MARPLPWREDPTPYKVLLSEFMCQQTRVQTVLPYFQQFTSRWSTLEAFAAAEESDVVEAWAGLGYYSRARRLHKCAVAAIHAGGLPNDVDGLLALPGIGPYTAGAIASIAFGVPAAAVDGNVERVMTRFFRIHDEVDRPSTKRSLQRRVQALHDRGVVAPSDLTQALMELGASVCSPRNPTCEACPLKLGCEGARVGDATEFPRKRPKKKPVPIFGVCAVVDGPDGTLLTLRPGEGLLGGLWSPPLVMPSEEGDQAALRSLLGSLGCEVTRFTEVGTVKHVFSHRALTARVYRATVSHLPAASDELRYQQGGRGMSTLAKKLVAIAKAPPLLGLLAADGDPPR